MRPICLSFTKISVPIYPGHFVKQFGMFTLRLSSCTPNRQLPVVSVKSFNSSLFEALNPLQKEQINLYVDALLQWNQKMNLTAVRDPITVMERHVEDSLSMISPICSSYISHCKSSSSDNLNILDVGTGPGLPGILLAIACPDWSVTLLESMRKRCVFLDHAIGLTGLSNVRIVQGRAESLGQDLAFRELYDVVVARAVAEMRILAEYCLPFVRVGGLFVAAKGHDPQDEVSKAERAIRLMGARVLQTCSVASYSLYGQRTAIICFKEGPTPRKYPREPGTPAKLPL